MANRSLNDSAVQHALETALRAAGRSSSIRAIRELSGGCIHCVLDLELDDGARLVAKVNTSSCHQMFAAEFAGLQALAETRAVVTPAPCACVHDAGVAILLLTRVEPPSASVHQASLWEQFGRDLAALHGANVGGRYGFESDNFIGSTPQVNHWNDDWIEFNRINRLGLQLKLARDSGVLESSEVRAIEIVLERLDRILPSRPNPSLLHGDLWSGNVLPTQRADGIVTCAMIDPACSIGDAWADIAMMKLFGGFHEICFASYREIHPEPEGCSKRILAYQLYHVLNHINIFGRGYVAQALSIAHQLGA